MNATELIALSRKYEKGSDQMVRERYERWLQGEVTESLNYLDRKQKEIFQSVRLLKSIFKTAKEEVKKSEAISHNSIRVCKHLIEEIADRTKRKVRNNKPKISLDND